MIKTINLNPIITDVKYIGLSDGDPRIAELSKRLTSAMKGAEGLFDDRVFVPFQKAAATLSFADIEWALEQLYDYADNRDIWFGKAGETPADQIQAS